MLGVPRLVAEDSLPAPEREHRQLASAATKHDRGHLEHASGLHFVLFSLLIFTKRLLRSVMHSF